MATATIEAEDVVVVAPPPKKPKKVKVKKTKTKAKRKSKSSWRKFTRKMKQRRRKVARALKSGSKKAASKVKSGSKKVAKATKKAAAVVKNAVVGASKAVARTVVKYSKVVAATTVRWASTAWAYTKVGAAIAGNFLIRTLGFIGSLVTGAISLLLTAVASLSMGVVLLLLMVVLGVAYAAYYWDSYAHGSARWVASDKKKSHRKYVSERAKKNMTDAPTATKVKKVKKPKAVVVEEGDIVVTTEAANDRVDLELPDVKPCEGDPKRNPLDPAFELTPRERGVLEDPRMPILNQMVRSIHDQGLILEFTMSEDGFTSFEGLVVNDAVFDLELSAFIQEITQYDILAALNSMREVTNDKRQTAYLTGRIEAMEAAIEAAEQPDVIYFDHKKTWALIAKNYNNQQARIPGPQLKKGFEDMVHELIDAHFPKAEKASV